MPVIRNLIETDEAEWRRLWAGYLTFSQTALPPEITTYTWQRLMDPASPMFCRVAAHGGTLAGFALCVLHDGSWTLEPICYLEDLFVDPAHRGAGIGRALIEDLVGLARTNGWARLYWHTGASNTTARHLYDRFAPADDFVRYRLLF